jgi:hypothetical protein
MLSNGKVVEVMMRLFTKRRCATSKKIQTGTREYMLLYLTGASLLKLMEIKYKNELCNSSVQLSYDHAEIIMLFIITIKKIVLQNLVSNLCISYQSVSPSWKFANDDSSELLVDQYVFQIPSVRLFECCEYECCEYMLVISTSQVKIHIQIFSASIFTMTIGRKEDGQLQHSIMHKLCAYQ